MNEKYHIYLPLWPKFSWTEEEKASLPVAFKDRFDSFDGDLPVTRLESWRAFHEFVEDSRFRNDEFIFRGQQRSNWDLIPSLARGKVGGVFTPEQSMQCLDSFRRASRGRKEFDPMLDDDLEMWALGQHHGLKTPLLDWTLSPYVALFFAFEKPDIDSPSASDSRVVFALNKSRVEARIRELKQESYKDDQVVRIYQPAGDSNRRLLSQAGLFLAVPPNESVTGWILTNFGGQFDDEADLSQIIMKVHIPNEEREECLRSLHRMNIHHASLFPDLIGSSAYTNFEFDVYRQNIVLPAGAGI
ncbi:FRG domain-containing protein [Desulfocurvibacter africanus]|uniref:FRG domain protein n=1 Tax=Desulfocurvibacter africanus subsp. africanus str. Walvis Bay TaxID=690850 RepID=F3YXF8_DESAF|nr:FRG domain-containing protein [Desulfocurvibacter africanus]EGJ51735.1 FRG domain protein [Desulfocurvibacter africanus subsp. africanus str. Walvis Bay]